MGLAEGDAQEALEAIHDVVLEPVAVQDGDDVVAIWRKPYGHDSSCPFTRRFRIHAGAILVGNNPVGNNLRRIGHDDGPAVHQVAGRKGHAVGQSGHVSIVGHRRESNSAARLDTSQNLTKPKSSPQVKIVRCLVGATK